MKNILLGFEIGTGNPVKIPLSHIIVTGITQLSGKTTCLEALIKRSGLKAVVFRTKIGERSFIEGTVIPPFFRDRSDWQFIQSLMEATLKERLKGWDRSKIIQLSKGTDGLLDFKKNVDNALLNPKLRAFDKDILTNLQAYLELVLPKLQTIQFSNTLELSSGVNIIDLERFSRDVEVQSLIIRSVIEEVLYNYKNTVIVLPEAWKFSPEKRGNPCKQMIEEFIRQGAANGNYLWIDSQEMASTDKAPLKQVSIWILGYQSEVNEVKHTLDQISLPKRQKPAPDEIMNLKLGHFYLSTPEFTKKVYVMPIWLDEKRAKDIALGKLDVGEIDTPQRIAPFRIATQKQEGTEQIDLKETSKRFSRDLTEMRTDFFDKIGDIQQQINTINERFFKMQSKKQEIDIDEIVGKVLQKMPMNNIPVAQLNKEEIISEVLTRVPRAAGAVTYEVAPLEKIKKDFLEEARNKIISDISTLREDEKKVLKYLESQAKDTSPSEIITKCLLLKVGGSQSVKVSNILKSLKSIEVVEKTAGGRNRGILKTRIKSLLGTHEATEQEIDNLYSHILVELLRR